MSRRTWAYHWSSSAKLARDAHEVELGPAGAEPLVGDGVAEHAGMQSGDAGLPGATVEQVPQPGDRERPALADPQSVQVGEPLA
jgi:hypothetical protein